MAASVVYDKVAESADLRPGQLFDGKKFWVAQRVPHRAALLDLIKANGGTVVPLEKQADWMIADHFRRDCPPGTISYDFVHKSLASGRILDPDNFPAGPSIGTARDPGSLVRPAKGSRNAFTPEEDRLLYKWAKDAAARGIAVHGNELYKKLEEQYPRHTWQSWRDRYLKRLQHQPPSAFSIPDNAPPSPPSDQSSRVVEAPVARKPLVKNKDRPQAAPAQESAASNEDYTVKQLAATFTSEDWESLYAFVEEIQSCSDDDKQYRAAWKAWAEDKDNQTAEQWRQYYEKVVRPQWLRDPASKREQIKKKVQQRIQSGTSTPTKSKSSSQPQGHAGVEPQVEPALSIPSLPVISDDRRSESRPTSEAIPQHGNGHESPLKRVRRETDDAPASTESAPPAKIARTTTLSQALAHTEAPTEPVGTQEHPLDISSAASSQYASTEQQLPDTHDDNTEAGSVASEDDLDRVAPLPRPPIVEEDDDDDDESVASTDYAHIAPLPRPLQIPEDDEDEDEDEEDLPSNNPTPRASKFAAFDTQAILSPSQIPHHISKLPRPPLDSSPPHHPDSEASTTQSLQEFSSYIQEAEANSATPLTRLPRPASPTPSATSEVSSAGSGDPDEPLAADEMDDFFAQQHAAGYPQDFISRALKRTRFRPGLAVTVLAAWKQGAALPVQRGIWSVEDDDEVEGGDGAALARLEKKHSLDGWGGITERINFLSAWSRR